MLVYEGFFSNLADANDFFENIAYKEAAKICEIELVETINLKCVNGSNKYFNYFLIDSRKFYIFKKFLKLKAASTERTVRVFLSGCLYLGKGQADRPYVHLEEAMDYNINNEKVKAIRDVWDKGGGVIILTFFHNATSNIASTREAIMIDFIGLENLTNIRKGTYYGGIKKWDQNILMNMGKFYITKVVTISNEQHFIPVLRSDLQ